jgi:hypothetical protein
MIYQRTLRPAVRRHCLRLQAVFFPQLHLGACKLTFTDLCDYQWFW